MNGSSGIVSLIDGWTSLSDFARDAGVTYGAAKQMRRRRSIPVDYWPAILASETGKQRGITADLLMKLHAADPDIFGSAPSDAPASEPEAA